MSEDVAAVVWREATPPDPGPVRRGALLRWIVAAGIGALFFFAFGWRALAYVAWGVSSVILILALVSPFGAHAAIDRVFVGLGRVVGTVLTWVLLAPVFYLFVTPFGLLRRRGARDPLMRRREPERESYWEPHRDGDDPRLDRPY